MDLLVSREGVLVAAAVAGVVALRGRWPIVAILLAFPVVYGVSVGMQTVRNDRTIMLVLPPLAVLAAFLVERPGTTLLVEAYGPYPDPERHRVVGRTRLIDGAVPPGTDYIVAAEGMYGRYLAGGHPNEEAAYEVLFSEHAEVARFTGNGPTIRILAAG